MHRLSPGGTLRPRRRPHDRAARDHIYDRAARDHLDDRAARDYLDDRAARDYLDDRAPTTTTTVPDGEPEFTG